jgi:hypothetical protein
MDNKIQSIISLKTINNYHLLASFEDGEKRLYDMNPTINSKHIKFNGRCVFGDLKKIEGLFEKVQIAPLGYGVIWNNEIDLDSEDIYYYGKKLTEKEYSNYI